MIYEYKKETVLSSKGLKLIKPSQVPKENLSEELINIQETTSKQSKKRETKQWIPNQSPLKINDELWITNLLISKLQPNLKGPYIIIMINYANKTCTI